MHSSKNKNSTLKSNDKIVKLWNQKRNFFQDKPECIKSPYSIGIINDFTDEEIEEAMQQNVRMLFTDKQIFFVSFPLLPHEFLSRFLEQEFFLQIKKVLGTNVACSGSTDVMVHNFFRCNAKRNKQPDGSIFLRHSLRRNPFFVIEVAYMHEDLYELFVEAEIYLNYYTDVEYVFLANIVRNREQPPYIEFILCTRRKSSEFFSNEQDRQSTLKHYLDTHCVQLCSRNKDLIANMDLHSANIEEIEKNFEIEILARHIVRLDDSDIDFIYDLNLDQILAGTNLSPENYASKITVKFNFLIEELEDILLN